MDEFQHQFLGLVTPTLPNGAPNPAYDDMQVNGTPDGRVAERRAFLRRSYRGADPTPALVDSLMPNNASKFVASDHGFAPQFLAIDASKVLVDLGLLSRPQTANCRPATGETLGKAKACWSGGAVRIYLNVAGRDPAGGGFLQVPAAQLATMFDEEAARLPAPPFLRASGDNVGASPPNSSVLDDRPAIDVANAWGLEATAYGHHEFDDGIARLLRHQARPDFPFLAANIVDELREVTNGYVTANSPVGPAVDGRIVGP